MKYKFSEINTVSNYISLLRVFLAIPLFIFLDHIGDDYIYRWYILGICFLAYLTDIADGFFARRLNQVTEFGKIIDPLADKLCMLIFIIKIYLIGEVSTAYFLIIVLRDVVIFTGGIFVTKRIGKVLPSNYLGKATVVSIGIYLLAVVMNVKEILWLDNFLLYLSVVLSFASVIGYALRGYEAVKWKKQNEAI